MITLILILIILTIFTYLLFIGILNIVYYVVLLAVMISFLFFKIKFLDYNKNENNKEQNKNLKKFFPKCKSNSFSEYIFLNYKKTLELIEKQDSKELEKLLSDKLYKEYIASSKYFKEEHYKNIVSDIELVKVDIKNVTSFSFEAEIDYKCIDYTLNRKNKVIRGYKNETREYGYLVKYVKKDDKVLLYRNELIYQK